MTEHDDFSSVDEAAWASGEPVSPQPDQAPAPQPGGLARVRELNRERQAAEALAQRSLADAAALRERVQHPGRAQDYRAPEDYTRAVAENAVREAGADLLARQAGNAREAAARVAQAAWAESTADFRQKVPDFQEVAHNPALAVTPVMADAIRDSERPAEIAYWLGKNPAEAARIAGLPPVSQATAIAKLESRIAAVPAGVSKAPRPFAALSGRNGGGGKTLEQMSFEEYRRARGF